MQVFYFCKKTIPVGDYRQGLVTAKKAEEDLIDWAKQLYREIYGREIQQLASFELANQMVVDDPFAQVTKGQTEHFYVKVCYKNSVMFFTFIESKNHIVRTGIFNYQDLLAESD
jgi:hypothetical protein